MSKTKIAICFNSWPTWPEQTSEGVCCEFPGVSCSASSPMAGCSKHRYAMQLPATLEVLLSLHLGKNPKTKKQSKTAQKQLTLMDLRQGVPIERDLPSTLSATEQGLKSCWEPKSCYWAVYDDSEATGLLLPPAITAGYAVCKIQRPLSQTLLPLRLTYNH